MAGIEGIVVIRSGRVVFWVVTRTMVHGIAQSQDGSSGNRVGDF
jgi:hypothetical protein